MLPACALLRFLPLVAASWLAGCASVSEPDGKEPIPLPDDDAQEMDGTPRRIDSPSLSGPQADRVRTGALPVIRFAKDSANLTKTEASRVREVAQWLKGHPERIVVAGGARTGSLEYSRQLGELRALTVRDLLVDRGVPAARMITVSYGEDGPVSVDGVMFGVVSVGADDAAPSR